MDSAQIEGDENKRLASLNNLKLSNSPQEERFDRIVEISAKLFSVPVAGVALVKKDIVWYKSVTGFQFRQLKRSKSLSRLVIEANKVFIVENTLGNPSTRNSFLVTDGPKLRFYAGFPIKASDGMKVGAFFIADRISRKLSEAEVTTLTSLAKWAELEVNQGQTDSVYVKTQEELSKRNRELAESKAKNEAMLENIGDGIIGINDGGEIIYVNKQAKTLLGLSEAELKGKMFIHAVSLVDENNGRISPEKRPIRTALLSKKKVVSRDLFYVAKDGSKFPVAITATPVVLYGQVIGGVNVFRDVTKEYEIDKMKTEFISLASHQLRTPLSAMKWFAEMLIDGEVGPLNKEQLELVNNVYQSNERMIDLVNALLNISRIESGRIVIEPKLTDLKALVEEVIVELKPKIEEKKLHLAISVHSSLPKVNIDPKLVRHVYMNLLTNATKYTPSGGEVAVVISKSGNEVISQITDNGYGIPKNQQNRVFTKFFRAQNVAKAVTDGTGLGLYLTKAIVDSSGGKIWFESEENKGTTFWFVLPLSGSQQKEGEVSLD
jgi:PAS domain S-box-containing protein